jgi:phage gp45-like
VVKSDRFRAILLDAISEHVNVMLETETFRQFGHISAVPAGLIVVVNDVGDLHRSF